MFKSTSVFYFLVCINADRNSVLTTTTPHQTALLQRTYLVVSRILNPAGSMIPAQFFNYHKLLHCILLNHLNQTLLFFFWVWDRQQWKANPQKSVASAVLFKDFILTAKVRFIKYILIVLFCSGKVQIHHKKDPQFLHCLSPKPLYTSVSTLLLLSLSSVLSAGNYPEPLTFLQWFNSILRFLNGKWQVSRNNSGPSSQKDLGKKHLLLVRIWSYQSLE